MSYEVDYDESCDDNASPSHDVGDNVQHDEEAARRSVKSDFQVDDVVFNSPKKRRRLQSTSCPQSPQQTVKLSPQFDKILEHNRIVNLYEKRQSVKQTNKPNLNSNSKLKSLKHINTCKAPSQSHGVVIKKHDVKSNKNKNKHKKKKHKKNQSSIKIENDKTHSNSTKTLFKDDTNFKAKRNSPTNIQLQEQLTTANNQKGYLLSELNKAKQKIAQLQRNFSLEDKRKHLFNEAKRLTRGQITNLNHYIQNPRAHFDSSIVPGILSTHGVRTIAPTEPALDPDEITSVLYNHNYHHILTISIIEEYVHKVCAYILLLPIVLCMIMYMSCVLLDFSVEWMIHFLHHFNLTQAKHDDHIQDNKRKVNFQNLKIKREIKSNSFQKYILDLSKFQLFLIFLSAIVVLFNVNLVRNCAKLAIDFILVLLAHLINYLKFYTFTTVSFLVTMLHSLFQFNLVLISNQVPNFFHTFYLPYSSIVPSHTLDWNNNTNISYIFNDPYSISSSLNNQYCFPLRANIPKRVKRPKRRRPRHPRIHSMRRHESGLKLLTTYIIKDYKPFKVEMMMDSGATICGINADLARKLFPDKIRTLKRPISVNTIEQTVSASSYCDLHIYDPSMQEYLVQDRFYLMEGLEFDFLASLHLLQELGWELQRVNVPFEHTRRHDETFGTCNNWNDENVRVKFESAEQSVIYQDNSHLNSLDPHANYIYKCTHPFLEGQPLASITRVHDGTYNVLIPPKYVHHISNYRASKEELARAKNLCQDRWFAKVPLEHLKKRSKWLYDKMCHLCYVKYKDVFARHQFDLGEIKNFEFKIDLKDESKGERIFIPQYHLAGDKRLVVIYNAIQNTKNGLYIPDDSSIHNVPIVVVRKKDGRYRLAYDLRLLNSHTKDVKSHIPSYNWLFELLQGRGLFTVSDAKNFFEGLITRARDRLLTAITAPNGRYVLSRGTYGFKNIATYAQQVSDQLMLPLGRAGAFIDDMFIKHHENATDEELLEIAEKFLARCKKFGILLHPEKTYFFVPEIEFLGYIFNQLGHKPQAKYVKKILGIKKPQTTTEIRAFLGLIQYIARYVHKLAQWTHYLTILTRKDTKSKWGPEQDAAFDTLIDKISKIGLLYHPTEDGTFLVQTDASLHSISGVLYQLQYDPKLKTKQWKLIEFYSKQIDPHLQKHHIGVKECLAISYAMNHWKHFLLRKKFYLDTDHRNLVSLYDVDATKAPNMKKQQIFKTLQDATAMFHFELAHLEGKNIILADYLSRDGSKLNSIDDATRGIKLTGITHKTENEKANYVMMLNKMKSIRNKIFSDANDDWKSPENIDPTILNAYTLTQTKTQKDISKDQFSFDHLDNLYAQEHGYFTKQNTGDIIESHDKIQLTKKTTRASTSDRYNNGLKSILKTKNKITYDSVDNKNNFELLQTFQNSQFDTFDSLIVKRLSKALANTLIQTSKFTPSAFFRLKNLFNLYSLKNINNHKNRCYPLINTPNYSIDKNYNRRSRRKRKKTKPFWQQESATTKLEKEQQSRQQNENDDEIEPDPTDLFHNPNDSHFLRFPFKVSQQLIDSLYNKLYLPEKYNDILSDQNLRKEQSNDSLCQAIIQYDLGFPQAKLYLKEFYPRILKLCQKPEQVFFTKNDILYIKSDKYHANARIVVPSKLIHPLLDYEHCINHLGHPGIRALTRILKLKYYWPYMQDDVTNYVHQCDVCIFGKGGKSFKLGKLSPLHAREHGEIVHMDFAGPFFKKFYILIIVDNYTGMVKLVPCYSQNAESATFGLLQHWYPQHGIPRGLLTDRGSAFIAEANKILYKKLGINKLFTSSYHPETNAKAERIVQETKKALRMVNITLDDEITSASNPSDVNYVIKLIATLLPSIEFSINQKVNNMTEVSPHMMVYGKNLNDIVDLKLAREIFSELPTKFDQQSYYEIVQQLKLIIEQTHQRYDEKYDKYVIIMKDNYDIDKYDDNFNVDDLVAYYVGDRSSTLKKIRRRFTGPWKIIERKRHNTVKILNLIDNKIITCHIRMLKRYHKSQFTPLCEIEKSLRAKHKAYNRKNNDKNIKAQSDKSKIDKSKSNHS